MIHEEHIQQIDDAIRLTSRLISETTIQQVQFEAIGRADFAKKLSLNVNILTDTLRTQIDILNALNMHVQSTTGE